MLKRIILLTLIISLSILIKQNLKAQTKIIKGSLTDAQTGKPIIGASLYIDGSTIGVASNAEGQFELKGFPEPPYELTVSSIGYKTTVFKIAPQTPPQVKIKLNPDALMLKEIKVEAVEGGWQKYGAFFLRSFLGYSEFASKCKLLNPQDLVFSYNNQARVLRVYADAPLRIRHQALGYEITYWLDNFEHDYKTQRLFFGGTSLYKDLIKESTSKGKQKRWRKNRASAYHGSLQHFFRSLYTGTIKQEGFEIRALKKVSVQEFYAKKPKQKDSIRYTETGLEAFRQHLMTSTKGLPVSVQTGMITRLMKKLETWYNDSEANQYLVFRLLKGFSGARLVNDSSTAKEMQGTYYEFRKDSLDSEKINVLTYAIDNAIEKQVKDGKIAVLYNTLLSADSLLFATKDLATKQLNFNDFLHVTYLNELEEQNYLGMTKSRAPGEQISLLSLNQVTQLEIYPNGHFNPPYGLLTEQYWAYEKIDKLLPLYFLPDKEE